MHEAVEAAREEVARLNDKKLRAYEAGKEILDRAQRAKRNLTAEEQRGWDRVNAEMDAIDRKRDRIINDRGIQAEREAMDDESRHRRSLAVLA